MIKNFVTAAGLLSLATAAAATTWNVDASACDDTTGTPAFCTIGAAIATAAAGDTIQIVAADYAENLFIDKSLTLLGANAGNCARDGEFPWQRSSGRSDETNLLPTADAAIRIAPGTDHVTIDGFTIQAAGVMGIAINSETDATVADVQILNNVFQNSDETLVRGQGVHLVGWEIACNFADAWNGVQKAAVEVRNGEMRDSRLHDNTIQGTFSSMSAGFDFDRVNRTEIRGNWIGYLSGSAIHAAGGSGALWVEGNKLYYAGYGLLLETGSWDAAHVDIGGVVFENNLISEMSEHGLELAPTASASFAGRATSGLYVANNDYTENYGLIAYDGSLVKLTFDTQGGAPGPLHVYRNQVQITGTLGGESPRTVGAVGGGHALAIGGYAPADIQLHNNTLIGIDAEQLQGMAQPTAVMMITDSATVGRITGNSLISAQCNDLDGFGDGISARDEVTGEVSGLPAGIDVVLVNNCVDHQYNLGVNYGDEASFATIQAAHNWWGCAEGPGHPGCADVAGLVDVSEPLAAEPVNCDAAPLFEDGFEIGSTARWSATESAN
ncbi:MAG: right-handed parallel beta-helix repeat-containing protein [Thermoanaerobaculia bacterium]